MLVKESGNIKLLKELQFQNAQSPILVKEAGNVKLLKEWQPLNA